MSTPSPSNDAATMAFKPVSTVLPERVRRILERLYALVSDQLTLSLEQMLSDFDQQLFRLAEQAHRPDLQACHFDSLRCVRQHRAGVTPLYLQELQAALFRIRRPTNAAHDLLSDAPNSRELRLVEDSEVSETGVLRAIAARHEARTGHPLWLLGQRFGVLAAAPAFDAAQLPVGPRQLGQFAATATRVIPLSQDARMLLLRSFDSQVMADYVHLAEAMNALLGDNNVLPGLSFVPLRTRPSRQNANAGAEQHAPRSMGLAGFTAAQSASGGPAERPYTAWQGDADGSAGGDDENIAFSLLQQLLSSRNGVLDKLRTGSHAGSRRALPTGEVVSSLEAQQAAPPLPTGRRTLDNVRQDLLAQHRHHHGEAVSLSNEDNDTFDLLGMMYAEIGRELRQGAASVALLERLQVPLLRVALQDRGFFVRSQHPARQLLNSVAEAGASWLAEDESDPQLDLQLQRAVDHVVEHYHGDATVFDAANRSLQEHLQTMARKAEISERRHVEAVRGKEKLELAKRRAHESIEDATRDQSLPKFLDTLLRQAWRDVLTLTLLRHGEDSDQWRMHNDATAQIVAASTGKTVAPAGLDRLVERSLALVGYHDDEASAIAKRLTGRADPNQDDATSRTELAAKLKARARLGEDPATEKPALPPRTAREEASFEHLRTLPFGTWIEFAMNQQGDVVRRRLAWYSPLTDHALFVNQRGQRVDEQSLDQVARLVACGQARVVTAERGRLVDRAWQAALKALRSFTGIGPSAKETTA